MHPRVILSVGNFFFSIFSTLVTFILLPYLSTFMPSAYTGFVLAGGALGAVVLFPLLPRLVKRYGAQQLALALALLEMIVLFALAATPGVIAGVLLIAATIAVQPFLAYQFDLLLEATFVDDGATGRVYSLFRTAWNIAALAAPLLLGALLVNSDSYGRIFIACAAMLAPIVIFFTIRKLPSGPAPEFTGMRDTLRNIFSNRDLTAVMCANFLLYLFYVWMPLYTPIYLHNSLGISWTNLGWIFAIMLIPYVVVEYPAAWIADRFLGDKELMFVGFIIAGSGLTALALLTPGSSLLTILLILTGARVGAALVESMVNAHFFRRVSKQDVNSLSVFRTVWPLSYFIAPIVGSLLLVYGGYSALFLSTGGFIIIAGVVSTLLIRDFQ